MTNIMLKSAGGTAAVFALATAFTGAGAVTPLYSGGGTLAEKVYRDIFNQYGSNASGDTCVGLPSTFCSASPYNPNVEALYVGVGSGNGKSALTSYNAANYVAGPRTPDNPPVPSTRDFGPFFGTGTGASWVPGTANPYPKVSFSGSDDPLTATDIFVYGNKFGQLVQFPALVTSIAIPFTPTANWNPQGKLIAGGSSKVNLSTNTVCGIFTGAITNWNNAEIKKDNKNIQLGSGTITVVYRNDSSGSTFLTTNGLLNQCGTASHPVSTHPFPDQWLTDNGITNTPPFVSNNTFFITVFNKGHLPSNFYNNSAFSGVTGGCKGSGGVQKCIDATVGGIGYLSPDFVQPIVTGNDSNGNPIAAAANLQTYYTYSNSLAAVYAPPAPKYANYIMQSAVPPSFVGGSTAPATNPLNWGVTNPTPTSANAYPIGGFTFIDVYSCYTSATDVAALAATTAGSLGLWRWYFGTSTENGGVPASTLTANGFSAVPAKWIAAAKTLLTANVYTRLGTPKKKNTACTNFANGA
jgi:ABC-type phosphate transport system substrate-binding protein